jgi:hypothetical protein
MKRTGTRKKISKTPVNKPTTPQNGAKCRRTNLSIELHCALENRLHGYIVVHQQLNRLQIGNRPVTSVTSLSINNLVSNSPATSSATALFRAAKHSTGTKRHKAAYADPVGRVTPCAPSEPGIGTLAFQHSNTPALLSQEEAFSFLICQRAPLQKRRSHPITIGALLPIPTTALNFASRPDIPMSVVNPHPSTDFTPPCFSALTNRRQNYHPSLGPANYFLPFLANWLRLTLFLVETARCAVSARVQRAERMERARSLGPSIPPLDAPLDLLIPTSLSWLAGTTARDSQPNGLA